MLTKEEESRMDKPCSMGNGGGEGRVLRLPPGFRFHPTDEELVLQYLRRKVFSCPLPASIIPEIHLSRFDPWDLPGAGDGTEKEKYFFNFREPKYQNGSRSNRAAGSGYWKATGKDRRVMGCGGQRVVGMKKFLVFYRGKPPHGARTDWVMHEFRFLCNGTSTSPPGSEFPDRKNLKLESPRTQMEDWVLCRIFQKKTSAKSDDSDMTEEEHVNRDDNKTKKRRVSFIDFLGRAANSRAAPHPPESEASCMTQASEDLTTTEEEEACFNSSREP